MTQTALPQMAPGGEWIHTSPDRPPIYVVHEAHIKRLLMEGGRIIDDPRELSEEVQEGASAQAPNSQEGQLRAEIEALKAQLAAVVAQLQPQDTSAGESEKLPEAASTPSKRSKA